MKPQTYASLFGTPDNRSLRILSDARSSREEVVTILKQALEAIDAASPTIQNGLDTLSASLAEHENAISVSDVDEQALKRLQGQLRQKEILGRDIEASLEEKTERMQAAIREFPEPMPETINRRPLSRIDD